MNKAQMSLEYIIKITLLLVVVVVAMGLILGFSDDIKVAVSYFFKNLLGNDDTDYDFPEIVEKNSFSLGEVSVYIESCHSLMSSLSEDEQRNIVCYVLEADETFDNFGPGADPGTDWESELSSLALVSDIEADFDKVIIKIEYKDVGNSIIISD